ncbi:uncharacterized protein JCM15063_005827 [Sporobolomyces koalae]|uniref:uncharacterized protein n=1 Tax=Sporobolomyces koalae TaxID=500713 RepID=UPI00316B80AF
MTSRSCQVPKSQRPGTCSKATKHLSGKVAAETKYDGERLQVHINLDLPFEQQIRIFSKSGRDSTQTRHLLHPIIRASLGLDMGDRFASDQHLLLSSRAHTVRRHTSRRDPPPTTLVLEGEMVPYNEDTQRIDEFWKLAWATRSNSFPSSLTSPRKRSRVDNSPETGDTGDPATPKRSISSHRSIDINNLHLKIVWFDVLVAGQESLVHHTYSERMARLRELVQPIPGFSMLAEQVTLDFDDRATALANLRQHFAKVITDRCEGLMLKPITSTYNDSRRGQHWIKLKKDFIPGAGDTLDFVVVGASWQRQRARELLVPPSAYTTFFIGLEASDLGAPMHRANKKHYHILFSASYGLDRQQLDALCHSIRQDRPVTWEPYPGKQPDSLFRRLNGARGKHTVYESACTSFTFSLADHLYSYALRPTVIFREPREMELNGAGFQRTRGCDYYELRWPRITKFARTDAEPLTLSGLQRTARDAMQIEPEQTDSQIIADLFSWSKTLASPARPPKESPQAKYERELQDWLRRLEAADGIDEGASSSPSEEDNTGSDIVCFSDNEAVSAESAAPCIYRLSSPRATSRHAATLSDLEKTPPVMTSDMPVPVPNASLAKSTAQPSPNSKLGQPQSTSRRSPGGKRSLSDSVCQALEVKRRKLSQSELSSSTPRRSASTGHLSLTIANLLDSPSLTESKIPTFNHAWTLFPPRLACDNSELPIPAHPLLESLNYLSTPEHVLWAAGLRVQSRPRLGATQPRRQGWIFVSRGFEAEAIEWANTALISQDLPVEREARLQKQTVWLIKADALETKELGHLGFGDELLSIL